MKKILLISASGLSLAFASSAFAGTNTVDLSQSGLDLSGYFYQQGSQDSVYAVQTGYDNTIGEPGGTLYDFQQYGAHNSLTAYQGPGSYNTLNGEQKGWNNWILSEQYGNSSTATIDQDVTDRGRNNGVTNSQGSNANLTASQSDSNNYIYNNQDGYSTAVITQDGRSNTSYGTQSGGVYGGQNYATVTQTGYENYSNYSQAGWDNSVAVSQLGYHNSSTIAQSGIGNVASVTQH